MKTWIEVRPDLTVSRDGRVRNAGYELKPHPIGKGYLAVSPMRNGVRQSFYVHRLVCEAFHGPCPPRHEVDHIDKIKTHNHAENLEWVTSGENKRRAGHRPPTKYGTDNHKAKITPAKVRRIRRLATHEHTHREIGQKIPCSISIVRQVLYGLTWKHVT